MVAAAAFTGRCAAGGGCGGGVNADFKSLAVDVAGVVLLLSLLLLLF